MPDSKDSPVISVIIPCFNQGKYLLNALESIWQQGYAALEVIVVDDGSTDSTKDIVNNHSEITYVYQPNKGLPAARNTGIRHSHGIFLIFLDADDWLLPGSIAINLSYLLWDHNLAFVSGAHEKVYVDTNKSVDVVKHINADHYLHLLSGNYIGMHGSVMFRRWVFKELLYNERLKACEDYDLCLRITQKFPVFHHAHKIAAYRIHQNNMSGNIPMMLSSALDVLKAQKPNLNTAAEKQAYRRGRQTFIDYYVRQLYRELLVGRRPLAPQSLFLLVRYRITYGIKIFVKLILKNQMHLKSLLGEKTPAVCKRLLHHAGLFNAYSPAVGTVKTGDFNRLTPLSTQFGYDRGGPLDRYYIEQFLKMEAQYIKGRTLEIGDNEYTMLFGKSNVDQSDILHIDASNTKASFIGDLGDAPHLPSEIFDCIILTQTLHLIYDFKAALATCHRILKPGGALLLTTPGITPIDHDTWKDSWYWSFTDKALTRLLNDAFPGGETKIESFGNVYIASAFLYGMGIKEVNEAELNHRDPHFQVIITGKAIK